MSRHLTSQQQLIIVLAQVFIALGALGSATYLARVGVVSGDAVVALYGTTLGVVGSAGVGRRTDGNGHPPPARED